LLLTIFFNPAELSSVATPADDVYIVLDIMRATTTLAVLFDQGATRVLAAETVEQAREAAQVIPGRFLCGERQTKTLPGFDYGNSPAQFSQINLTNSEMILTTSNGTRALFACPRESTLLAGSFYNGQAVVSYALAQARARQCNISIVCAAEYGYFALEDTTCAGFLALELLRQEPQIEICDSVHAAVSLYESYPAPRLLEYARSARDLVVGGQEADLAFCIAQNKSTSVPRVTGVEAETGLLVLERVAL
jgi:2-phosphosulfolactate phosphatase